MRRRAPRQTATMHSFLIDTDRDRGYTLLELLLALTLTALLILAGSYGWRQHQSTRQLASSAHQLLDFIVCQQWHAAWGNRRCRLTAITVYRWQLRGDPQCGLAPGAADGACCIEHYAGVHLSVSTTGELNLRGTPYRRRRARGVDRQAPGRVSRLLSCGRL